MNSKKYKLTIVFVVILMLLAGGLFVYDNFYLAQQERANLVTIYVAREDVQANTEVKEDMFMRLAINRDSVLPAYITNFSQAEGMVLRGAILAHEPLTTVRLKEAGQEKEGEFSLRIDPDFLGDVAPNDKVRVYVQLTDRHTMHTEVKVLFDAKRVIKMTTPDNVLLSTGREGIKDANVFVNVTEQELMDYYVARERGRIIVAKFDLLDMGDIESDGTLPAIGESVPEVKEEDKFDTDSEIVQNAGIVQDSSDEGISVMSYVVQVGDDIDSLSIKFKTDALTVSELNEGRSVFIAGETITVPAE